MGSEGIVMRPYDRLHFLAFARSPPVAVASQQDSFEVQSRGASSTVSRRFLVTLIARFSSQLYF